MSDLLSPPRSASPGSAPPQAQVEAAQPSALRELTLSRIRSFLREPEALFWTFGFPIIMAIGLGTVYSATYDSTHRMMSQAGNMGIALVVMWVVSRIPPQKLMSFAIPLYVIGIVLLILSVVVPVAGVILTGRRPAA